LLILFKKEDFDLLEKMFNYENPVWQFMNRVADLLILNFIFLIFSIPIVTIGANYTALTYTMLKIVKNEDTYIWREYWSSFKSNFKQATQMWLIFIPFILILSCDVFFWVMDVKEGTGLFPKVLKVTTVIVIFIVFAVIIYAFPVLSHFDNTVKNSMKNALIISVINIPYTLYFMVLMIAPIVAVLMEIRLIMAYVMFGFSLPSFMACLGWKKIFKKLEPPTEEPEEMEDSEWEVPVDKEAADMATSIEEAGIEETGEEVSEEFCAEEASKEISEEN